MNEPDPVSWIREIGTDVPWEYDLLQAFVRAYLRAGLRRRAQAERALPDIEREAATWLVLPPACGPTSPRSPTRRSARSPAEHKP